MDKKQKFNLLEVISPEGKKKEGKRSIGGPVPFLDRVASTDLPEKVSFG